MSVTIEQSKLMPQVGLTTTTPDPYTVDYDQRREEGVILGIDRANAARARAEQAAGIILEEADDCTREQVMVALATVRKAAALTAALHREGEKGDPDRLAQAEAAGFHCEQLAKAVDDIDPARFEGLDRAEPHKDQRGRYNV